MDGDEQAGRDEQSRLTRSFVDQARAAGPWRAGSQLVVTMLIATIVAGGCIGYGFFTRPSRHQVHRTSALALTGTSPAPAGYSALAGPGCSQSPSAGFRVYGWFGSGLTGFDTVRSGGWASQGCDGGYIAMPMSGSRTTDDPQNYGLWTFRTGESGKCQVSVYVPKAASIVQAGGDPAYYQVFDATSASGPPAGSFAVSQVGRRGRWVSAGSFPVSSGFLTVKADSRGQDWAGNTKTYAHIALDVVRLACDG